LVVLPPKPVDHRLDKDAQVVVPKWTVHPEEMLVDQAEYELTGVTLTSISLVTTRAIKVRTALGPNAIVKVSTKCSRDFVVDLDVHMLMILLG